MKRLFSVLIQNFILSLSFSLSLSLSSFLSLTSSVKKCLLEQVKKVQYLKFNSLLKLIISSCRINQSAFDRFFVFLFCVYLEYFLIRHARGESMKDYTGKWTTQKWTTRTRQIILNIFLSHLRVFTHNYTYGDVTITVKGLHIQTLAQRL